MDSNRVYLLNELGYRYHQINPVRGLKLGEEALEIAQSIDYKYGIYDAYNTMGSNHFTNSKYAEALQSFFNALKVAKKLNYDQQEISLLQNIGAVYCAQNHLREGLKYFLQVDSIRNQAENPDPRSQMITLRNISEVYINLNKIDSADYYILKAIDISNKTFNSTEPNILLSYADIQREKGNFNEALEALNFAINNLEQNGYTSSMISGLYKKATTFQKMNVNTKAFKEVNKGIKIAQENEFDDLERQGYLILHDIYINKKDYKNALEAYHEYKRINDKIYNQAQLNQLAQVQAQYEIEQKQKDYLLNEQKLELQEAQLERQNWIMMSLGVGMFTTIFFLVFLFKSNRDRKRKNTILTEQKSQLYEQQQELMVQTEELTQLNEEVLSQRDHLEKVNINLNDYNNRLTDSISAAQIIQEALLPFENRMKDSFQNNFVIYKPKDIVSGDFYWLVKRQNFHFLAVIDCTGHGVPGAFMSLLAYSLLNEIVEAEYESDPSKILNLLHAKLIKAISYTRHGKKHDAGMDIALCRMEYLENDDCKITYAGAKRPLYYVKDNQLQKISGTRLSIGGNKRNRNNMEFSNSELSLSAGDSIYLTTDGYIDNPNKNRKKFGTPMLEKLIEAVHGLSMTEQKEAFELALEKHQGNEAQRDDITLVGVRI
ncbi:SpoIIE family protein phosphatase [Sediminitomix flava]|uniref:SpoIIE family protein phosphatase n=1 Tax=Sediminitomix flava TaxID=379075 RepID=UPI001304FF7D|nr:SpoIIE family protein phosphatase [Sediminitomix flava]